MQRQCSRYSHGMSDTPKTSEYIRSLELTDPNVVKRSTHIEQERKVALGDLLRENQFAPVGLDAGPYDVRLEVSDNRLVLSLTSEHLPEAQPHVVKLPVGPFRAIIRDYFMICESYFEAIKASDPYKVEAMDMGRRGVHNEGSEKLRSMLADKVTMDFDTARRLFTLMCVLHIR